MKFSKIIRYLRQRNKSQKHEAAINKISAVDTLIAQKYLIFDTVRYQVAMLDNLWSLYKDEKQVDFCKSLKYYCDIQNAYFGAKVEPNANLLISLKYENGDVSPFAYFDGKLIHQYKK